MDEEKNNLASPQTNPVSHGLKVLMLSTDADIFTEGSAVRSLMVSYGSLLEELHIIVYTRPGFSVQKLSDNVTAHPTNTRYRLQYFTMAKYLGKQIIEKMGGKPLITSQEAMTNIVARKLAKKFKLPFQAQVHVDFASPYFAQGSLIDGFRAFIYARTLRSADCIRVVSHRIKESIEKLRISTPATVLPIWVDFPAIEATQARDLHREFPQFNFIVVMAVRLTKEKDVETALRAFSKFTLRAPKAGLLILGDGPLRHRLVQFAALHDVDEHVVFLGKQTEPFPYLKGADVVLLTSRYEGYGRVLVEAAAAERAIVTTDVGIAGSTLKNREEALVVPVGDSDAVAENLFELMRNNILRTKLGYAAREAVHQEWAMTKEEYLQKMLQSFTTCGTTEKPGSPTASAA